MWTPVAVQQVGIRPQLNPPLVPPLVMCSHDLLQWNILFRTTHYQRSPDPAHRSWSNGRYALVVWPSVATLWSSSPLEVSPADRELGVTYRDVIEAISTCMNSSRAQQQYETGPEEKQGTPGSPVPQGSSRSGWPGPGAMYDGLETINWFASTPYGRPILHVFELKTGTTEEERGGQVPKTGQGAQHKREQGQGEQPQQMQQKPEEQTPTEQKQAEKPTEQKLAEQGPEEQKPAEQESRVQKPEARKPAAQESAEEKTAGKKQEDPPPAEEKQVERGSAGHESAE